MAIESAGLAQIETFDNERIAVVRFRDGDKGWTSVRRERCDRAGNWTPCGSEIRIPNCAIFLVRDAMDRSCQLARGDRR